MYIEKISGPDDVKKLGLDELTVLADEMRRALIYKTSIHGGHCAPNFGIVEATIALHYVFNSPEDKIVFDVSHQSYPHKMLTGRTEAFLSETKFDEVSGYSEPEESVHDHFVIGHTSTSVSLATGLAKGRDLVGGKGNVIAVIGDGSLSGGEALEGLNVAGELNSNLIVIVNDNQMSIAENHGGMYEGLKMLRESNGASPDNLFRAMNLDYVYVPDGNDIQQLIDAFRKVKDSTRPIVVHINTLKGKGYKPAEENKEVWHWHMPYHIESGKTRKEYQSAGEDYADITAKFLIEKMKEDEKLVVVAAGTPASMGFTKERRELAGKQYVDCGIAEEHAVAMISGLAKAGAHPVFGTFSTFIQRAYDQLQQDLCVNNNPATILIFGGGIESMNDVTHTCWYDIPLMSNIPNLIYLAPTTCEEYIAMLNWSIEQNDHPVAIRVPLSVTHADKSDDTNYSLLNKSEIVHQGSDIAIVGLGSCMELAKESAERLKQQYGIDATIINPKFISGIDAELFSQLKRNHKVVVSLESGLMDGGYGEKISRFFGDTDVKVLVRGASKEFADRYSIPDILRKFRMTADRIAEDAYSLLK